MKHSPIVLEAGATAPLDRAETRATAPAAATTGVHLLRGRHAVTAMTNMLRQLASRTGQASAGHWLEYHLSSPSALKKIPTLLLMGLDARVNPAEAATHDLIGAVLLYEYQVAGRGLRVFATDDTTGSTSVIAPPHLRLQVAEAACQALLANGALAAMVTFQGRPEEATAHPARGVTARFQIATRTRTVPLYLALGPNHQATLATLGKHTRRNLRYYRRRLESEVGAEFVPHANIGRDEFLELNRASTNPVPVALADWRYRSIARTPGAVLAGLRSRDGRWLSLIGGRRYLQEAEIDWQINLAGLPRYSLSTVMRSYMLEHEVAMGTSKLAFAGGTPHSMRHSFVDIYATDVIALRQSAAGRALRRFASSIFPERNFLGAALQDRQLHWTRG
jgi:hypothetical protein